MRSGRPSTTAMLVAQSLVFLDQDPKLAPLVPPAAVEATLGLMEVFTPNARRRLRLMRRPLFRSLVWAMEGRTIPGMMLHYAARKRWLEAVAREAIRDGFRQVVVLGAGFDTLALRLAGEHADVLCLEIDHPATQRVKEDALRAHGYLSENLVLRPLDLAAEDLDAALRKSAFKRGERTLFIAEGLLMYLAPEAVDRVFASCVSRGGAGSRFAFTFMERLPGGRVAFRGQSRGVDLWLRMKGEPFQWGVPLPEIEDFLADRRFACRELATPEVLRSRYLAPHGLEAQPLADGDHGCLAEIIR